MHNIIFSLLLFISSLAQAQEITVYAGQYSQKVLPETAQKFNLTPANAIVSDEMYAQVTDYDRQLRGDTLTFTVSSEPLTVTGDGSTEHPYNPQTSAERISALADELQATDPVAAAMLFTVAGSLGDDKTRMEMSHILHTMALRHRAYLMQQIEDAQKTGN